MSVNHDPTMKIFAATFFMAMMWTAAHTAHAKVEDEGDRSSDVDAKHHKTKTKVEAKARSNPSTKTEAKTKNADTKANGPAKIEGKPGGAGKTASTKTDKTVKIEAEGNRAEIHTDKFARTETKTGKQDNLEKADAGKTAKAEPKSDNEKGKSAKVADSNEHVIAQGETLGKIAVDYGITLSDLMAANSLTNGDKIFYGQKLQIPADPKDGVVTKAGVVLRVPKGFTINRIAALYGVTPRAIIRANNMINPDRLREGDKLLVPGAKQVIVLVPPPPCFKNPITFYRIRTDETLELPVEYCNGKPNADGLKTLSDFVRSIARPTDTNLHPRLLTLLQQVSDHYPGKRIEIVSGQRAKKDNGSESFHTKGQALDFRVEGVSNLALTNYIRSFDKVGVGYYPNSVFIHMDTRERNAYWIDYSEPGEKAIYGRKGLTDEQLQEIRDRRKTKKHAHERGLLSADNNAETVPAMENAAAEAAPNTEVAQVEEQPAS